MQSTINNFINNESINYGLMLVNLPTGYGKTYMSAQSIYQYIKNSERPKKIFFITTLIKNLPLEELKKVYVSNGEADLFDKDVLVIKSNYDFVYEKLLELDIPDKYRTKSYYELREKIILIKKFESRKDYSLKVFISDIENQIRSKYEKNFRNDIYNIIKQKMPNNKSDRREWIRKKKEFQWIGKLYPTVFMDEYKVFMLTISKFLVRNTTLIEPSYDFLKNDITKDAIIFIDEFDATKETIQNHIIQNAISSQDDYIRLFEQIYKSIQTHTFPKSMVKPYSEYLKQHNNYITLEGLKKEAEEIYNDYYLQYSYKTTSDGIDRKQSFLFNDNSYHTMLRNNRNYIRVTPNKEEGQVQIFFENKDEYYNNRSENDIIIYRLIRAINSFLNKFRVMVFNWANQYVAYVNNNRRKFDDQFTIENAINSIYREFSLSRQQIQLMIGDVSETTKRIEKEAIPDMSFYETGFKYFEFIDGDEHLGRTIFNHVQISDTPEKIILFLAKRSKILGISATASIETVTGNFDISYLSRELGEGFKMIDQNTSLQIRKELESRWEMYRTGEISVELDVVDYNKGNLLLDDRLKELFIDRDVRKKYSMELKIKSAGCKYIWQRYCNIISSIKNFMESKDIKSFLCLNSVLPDYNKASFDLELFSDIASLYAKDMNIEDYEIAVLKSDNFDIEKDIIISKLEQGKKLFIFSSYKTIGAGQNLQYKVPDNQKVINIYNSGISNDGRMSMKDMDGLYLGDITNIVANTYDKENFDKIEMLNFFFEAEYLYQNDEISFDVLNRLIKQGFKSYSKSSDIDNLAIKVLRNSRSIRNSVTRDVIQAVGRICRTFNKNLVIHIFTTEELLAKMDVSKLNNIILNPEMEKILEYKNQMKVNYISEDLEDVNKAERISSRGKNYIMRILSRNWSEKSVNLWKSLRECVLEYPTSPVDNNKYGNIVESLYIKNKNNKSCYLFAQKGDFSDVVIDYDNDKVIFAESKRANGRIVSCVSEDESRLQQILKYPGMKDYFIESGWATTFGREDLIISPVLSQSIYKGALGEVAGKFILRKELGIDLKEITDLDKYEFFDYELSEGIYVDFKHWKYGYPDDRQRKIKEITDKLSAINGKKVLIINIVADEAFGTRGLNEGGIIEIPRLIDDEGKIDLKVINYLKGVLENDFV